MLFPGAKFVPNDFTMDIAQVAALINQTNGSVSEFRTQAWKVSTGGWLFLDHVPGRDDVISYAVAVDREGKIKGVDILECLPRYDAVRNAEWLAQFVGRQESIDDPAASIKIISSTSLSSEHIAQGIKRIYGGLYSVLFERHWLSAGKSFLRTPRGFLQSGKYNRFV